jgi:hypothetical protein
MRIETLGNYTLRNCQHVVVTAITKDQYEPIIGHIVGREDEALHWTVTGRINTEDIKHQNDIVAEGHVTLATLYDFTVPDLPMQPLKIKPGKHTLRNGDFVDVTEIEKRSELLPVYGVRAGMSRITMRWTELGTFNTEFGCTSPNDIVAEGHVEVPIEHALTFNNWEVPVPIKLTDYPKTQDNLKDRNVPSHDVSVQLPCGKVVTIMVPTFHDWAQPELGKFGLNLTSEGHYR